MKDSAIADLERVFGTGFLDSRTGAVSVRNRHAHLNMLWEAASTDPKRHRRLNLTKEVVRTRCLMAYDRKLKNAVTKSIIGVMERENIAIAWTTKRHLTCGAKLGAQQAKHLKHELFTENLHDPIFLAMVGDLFRGRAANHVREILDEPELVPFVDQIFEKLGPKNNGKGSSRDAKRNSAQNGPQARRIGAVGKAERSMKKARLQANETLPVLEEPVRANGRTRFNRRERDKSDRASRSSENPFFVIDPNEE